MEKSRNIFNLAFITAFLVVGIVAVSAVAFKYSGNLQLKFGADGIQLQIRGQEDVKRLE